MDLRKNGKSERKLAELFQYNKTQTQLLKKKKKKNQDVIKKDFEETLSRGHKRKFLRLK